jgi:hypothetical protein
MLYLEKREERLVVYYERGEIGEWWIFSREGEFFSAAHQLTNLHVAV